ncbi:FAD dependent oxidoreductase [Obba rivulosa]|uniref:FAD dependent oxidoreductase n=1 Tax=Obba rivulosa TaxID=1052685 RepID=A0A8E2DUG3_9APHY|nr:FAD dependent oxidoreductase [Obba rivulosa]
MPSTVILGSGIVGLSTAYYLATLAPAASSAATPSSSSASSKTASPPHEIHLVDPAPRLFASASGNAAGFIAKDWFAPALAPLGALSFDLHRELAAAHDGRRRWGWAESVSYSLDRDGDEDAEDEDAPDADADEREESGSTSGDERESDWVVTGASRAQDASSDSARSPATVATEKFPRDGPAWLRASPTALQAISDTSSTGQVSPREFCQFLLEECRRLGVRLHHPARATALLRNVDGSVRVRIEHMQTAGAPGNTREAELPCTSLVLAAGCWTPQVYSTLFPNAGRVPRITPLAGWSTPTRERTLALPTHRAKGPAHCHAIFTSDPSGFSPELFSRATGELWLGGLNSSTIPLPPLPPDSLARLEAVGRRLIGPVRVVRRALCFRPVSATGRPIVARVHEADLGDGVKPRGGVFIATGHGPWGIALAPGTGRVVAEMVLGRRTSADVGQLGRW